jgi:hypothetical protein
MSPLGPLAQGLGTSKDKLDGINQIKYIPHNYLQNFVFFFFKCLKIPHELTSTLDIGQ